VSTSARASVTSIVRHPLLSGGSIAVLGTLLTRSWEGWAILGVLCGLAAYYLFLRWTGVISSSNKGRPDAE
jgi:protein-S-isoprenylcysteine O-methyltransferase Ste14